MFDVGWSELLIIAIVAIVVVGPKDLPKMLRAFGKATARMRTTANEFRRQFDEALKEAELDDVHNVIDDTRKLDPRSKLTQMLDPIRSAGEDIRSSLQSTTSMSPPAPETVSEVTTPVDAAGEPVPLPADKADEAQAAAAEKKPRRTKSKAAVQPAPAKAAASKPKAAPRAATAKGKTAAEKPAAAVKPARQTSASKTAASKATAPKAAPKAAARKTTKKTGSEA